MKTEEIVAKAMLACVIKAAKRIAALSDAEIAKLQLLSNEYPTAAEKRRIEIVDAALEVLIP